MDKIKGSLQYLKGFLKWLVIALLLGSVGGLVGAVFHISIDEVTHLREANPWLVAGLPLGGLAICALYRLSKTKIDTNRVIESVRGKTNIPFIMAPLIFIGTVITHLFGGSAGREGAALQLGGSLGYNIGKLFRLNERDMRIIVMTGMSAVFSALFGTPITATIFSLEVTSVGVMYYAGLFPCMISAFVAAAISGKFGLSPVHFVLSENISLSPISALSAAAVAILCAFVSVLFCYTIEKGEHFSKKFVKNDYVRTFAGGALIVALTFVVGNTDYNGAGMHIIEAAMNGNAIPYAFLLKILFTVITIAAGFKGGEIVPTFFIGATFGCTVAPLFGMSPTVGAAIGFVALFCGVVNCPIASMILAFEVFGAESLPVMALVCAVTYIFSGYSSLYKSQKIMYSKIEAKFINADTK